MTIEDFAKIIQSIDPDAARYQKIRKHSDRAYTVWNDYATDQLMADGRAAECTKKIQIDYYTLVEDDPIAQKFYRELSKNDEITVSHLTEFDPETRYIRHIFDCEVLIDNGVLWWQWL